MVSWRHGRIHADCEAIHNGGQPLYIHRPGAIRLAQENAARLGHSYVGSEHLLLGLASQEYSLAARLLRETGADSQTLRAAIAQLVGTGVPNRTLHQGLTPQCCQVIQRAAAECRRLQQPSVSAEHLLLGLLREPNCSAVRLLADCQVDSQASTGRCAPPWAGRRTPSGPSAGSRNGSPGTPGSWTSAPGT